MKFSGKKIMSVLLIGLLCTAIFLNWKSNGTEDDKAKILGEAAYVNNDVKIEEQEPFHDKRIERQKAKEQALELIEQVLNDQSSDTDVKKEAQTKKIAIAENIVKESDCETILDAKGFKDVLVTISGEDATVIVNSASLLPAQVVQIQEAVSSSSGILPEKIKIVLSR